MSFIALSLCGSNNFFSALFSNIIHQKGQGSHVIIYIHIGLHHFSIRAYCLKETTPVILQKYFFYDFVRPTSFIRPEYLLCRRYCFTWQFSAPSHCSRHLINGYIKPIIICLITGMNLSLTTWNFPFIWKENSAATCIHPSDMVL
jgi:hypothetical protein